MLTIREKREFFARLVRARLSELPNDSDLWQEFRTTMDGATRKLLDKLRAISFDNELDPEARNLAPKDDGVTVVVRIRGTGRWQWLSCRSSRGGSFVRTSNGSSGSRALCAIAGQETRTAACRISWSAQ